MKALIFSLILMISASTMHASNVTNSKDKNKKVKQSNALNLVRRQMEKHIYFPQGQKADFEGTADVMFQVYPEGDIHIVLIQTKNPKIQQFIEKQAAQMKIDSSEIQVGQVFKYRFEFKRQA
jgi:hypothetical protein